MGLEVLDALLGQRGHGRMALEPLGAGHADGVQLAGRNVLGRRRAVGQHEGDLAADHVDQGRPRAAIGHMGHLHAQALGQQFGGQVVGRAQARAAIADGAWLGLHPLRELLQVVHRQLVADHEEQRETRQQADGHEVLLGVVGQLAKQVGVGRQRGEVGREDQAAQFARARRVFGGDVGAGPRLVHDDHGAAQGLAKGLAHGARHGVRAAACGKTHHPFDGLAGLGVCRAHAQQGRGAYGQCGLECLSAQHPVSFL
ncbi:conserved hypothetical protein [Ricinus communis]|uniref:Uncharacterized protein n=1 Tax=Ricinus communis TaxID=3988 RepID=B9TFA3_RICCO|nr:conserved hypothetical protein [Ricinus communis]